MNIEKIKTLYEQKGTVKFKLYGLEYIIEKLDNGVAIYPDLYKSKKTLYTSIDEIFTSYYIYNENIESNDSRIQNIS